MIGTYGQTIGTYGQTIGTYRQTIGTHGETIGTHGQTIGTHGQTIGTHCQPIDTYVACGRRFCGNGAIEKRFAQGEGGRVSPLKEGGGVGEGLG